MKKLQLLALSMILSGSMMTVHASNVPDHIKDAALAFDHHLSRAQLILEKEAAKIADKIKVADAVEELKSAQGALKDVQDKLVDIKKNANSAFLKAKKALKIKVISKKASK